MARSHKLPKQTVAHLAKGVAAKLVGAHGPAELAEAFELWFLGRSAVTQPDTPLVTLAHRTGYWHHQIRRNGQATDYAISSTHGPKTTDWEIQAVMSSQLAAQIDEAIDWIDTLPLADDPVVRLLVAPAYLLTAFWLPGTEDRVVVIAEPSWFTHLRVKTLYRCSDFLRELGKEQPAQETQFRPGGHPIAETPLSSIKNR